MHTLARLTLILSLTAIAVGVAASAAGAQARPNVVLVLTDDQRWDQLAQMPNVQRELVGRGVTFTNSFAVNPLCCPSRATILTGRYSHSTRVYRNQPPYGGATSFDDSSTIGTWLQAAGFRTAYIGKYLNGYWLNWVPPGWNRWIGFGGGYFRYSLSVDGLVVPHGTEEASYSTDVLAREAQFFASSGTHPFFLVLGPYAPHSPATPAPRHAGAFAEHERAPAPSFDEEDVTDKPRWVRSLPRLAGPAGAAAHERKMLASLLAVDDAVGALVDSLAAAGQLENTVFLFTSDNGLLLGEHRLVNQKVAPYEESIRVPLVVRHDALGLRPRREDRLVGNVDVAPTIAELAGAAAQEVEGRSLVPILRPEAGVRPAWRRSLLVEHLQARSGTGSNVPTYCAVRRPAWKYVVYSTREEELYDLAADPHELVNRARDPLARQTLFSLRSEVKRLCDPPPPGFGLKWLCTLEGTRGVSLLRGTAHDDRICGRRGAERIEGRRGADALVGGGGPDIIAGGLGRDRIEAGSGADLVLVRDGEPDRIVCGPGRDRVVADGLDVVARDCERVARIR